MPMESHQLDHVKGCDDCGEGRCAEYFDSHVDNPRMNSDMNHVSGIANVIVSRRVKNVAYGENWEWENAKRSEVGRFCEWSLWSWGYIRSHLAAREQ